jgi:hypothetical protein
MGRWANAGDGWWESRAPASAYDRTPGVSPGDIDEDVDRDVDRPAPPNRGIGREAPFGAAGSGGSLDRLRQLRGLAISLAQAATVDDIVDTLSVQVAADCGAETSVVYLMDPDQEEVLRLAAARGVPGSGADPAVLCRDGGALIARAVRARQPQLQLVREPGGAVTTAVACPLLLRAEPMGAFAYGFAGRHALDDATCEFLLGASGVVALALDRTAATQGAREAQQVSEYMTTVLRRVFGGEPKRLA